MESSSGYLLFTKMHGIGNDYIYLDCRESAPDNLPRLSQILSNRHTGIGGDGIILIENSNIADFRMRIFNTDGSEATMCGNGSRCVGKYVSDYGLTDKDEITLETGAGIKILRLHKDPDGIVQSVTVDMGRPEITLPTDLTLDGTPFAATVVSMGNPHCVIFLPSPSDITDQLLTSWGTVIERHPLWPDRTNVEFAALNPDGRSVTMRVWERGSGETMACGTGACAVAAAAIATGRIKHRTVTINLRGGDLRIEWPADEATLLMSGPATKVFEGRYPVTSTSTCID